MNPSVEQRLMQEGKRLDRVKSGLRQGEVTAVSPLEVTIGDSDVSVLATALDGVELQVGDRVSIEVQERQILVLGRNTNDPVDAGGGADSVPDATASVKGKLKLTGDLGGTADSPTVPGLSGKQPLDSDLTAIAALSTTSFGRSLLTQADASAARSTLGAAATSHTHAQSDVTNLTSDLAAKAPLASPTFTGNVVVPNADASNEAVNLGQQQQAILEANAGYTRLADVDKAPIAFNTSGLAGDWSGSVTWATFGTRSGNVITGASNGLLHSRDYVWGGLETPDPSDAVSLGDEFVLTQEGVVLGDAASNGIWVVTRTGGPSATFELTRRADADTTGELVQYNIVQAQSNGAQYKLVTADPITINTTAQTWEPYWFFPSLHARTHAPDGSDPLPTATPVSVGTANAEGSSTSFARADHVHAERKTGPFRAYRSSALDCTGSLTAITFNTEDFDVEGWYDTSNGRYTPQVAGYYQFTAFAAIAAMSSSANYFEVDLMKNGSMVGRLFLCQHAGYPNYPRGGGCDVVYLNGTTDYVQIGAFQSSGTNKAYELGSTITYFAGHRVG